MKSPAMSTILKKIEKKKIVLSKLKALEIFARDGSWQTIDYADKIGALDAWEIDKVYKKDLQKNIPKAKISITDSIKEIHNNSHFNKYDFIVVDNPQNCYGKNREYCEHFDVIPAVAKLLHEQGIIIFNINKEPFNYNAFPDWKLRRENYYGRRKTEKFTVTWLLQFYTKLFTNYGYHVNFCFNMSRQDFEHNDYLHYLVYSLTKL